MPNLDEIADRVRDACGADFAFVLTKRGRLVTQNAPSQMPEAGRARLLAAGLQLRAKQVAELSLPRESLVPYGGAAPVDVFVAVGGGQAVLCVVMASWADKRPVLMAVGEALVELDVLLGKSTMAKAARARGAKESSVPPAPRRRAPSSAPPPKRGQGGGKGKRRGALAGLVQLSGTRTAASPALKKPPAVAVAPPLGYSRPLESMPEIVIGTASIGRETLAAIDRDLNQEHAAASSMPDIRVELASLGRQSELELRAEEAKRMQSLAAMARPDALVAPAVHRMTQPWTETAADAKRAAEGARHGRKLAPPKVTMKLDDPDDEVLEALLVDDADEGEADVPKGVRPPPKGRAAATAKTTDAAPAKGTGAAPAKSTDAARRTDGGERKKTKPPAADDSWTATPAVPRPAPAPGTQQGGLRTRKPSLDVWREALERASREQEKRRR